LGTQNSFSDGLSQGLLGVLVHGSGVRLYRHFDNVTKGANLTIYAIEKEIERWRDEHDGNFPEEIYIQLDGGSENANHYVLAYLEYMVAKRYCLKLFYTRLPTGHTHDDIDAAFGRLWLWLRSKQVESPSAFKTMVEEAFKNSKLKFQVFYFYISLASPIILECSRSLMSTSCPTLRVGSIPTLTPWSHTRRS
jgi:hypothetical protein